MVDIGALIQRNTTRWQAMHIHPNIEVSAQASAKLLMTGQARFQNVAQLTHVPWGIIAVISSREYGFLNHALRWDCSLAQGDPWNRVSTHVPKGRGPFKSWEDAAYDALVNCAPYAGKWKDWSIGGALTLLEEYNGLGYAMRGLPSPYIFAGTDQYNRGKFDSDGHFDPFTTDTQLGCAVILKEMYNLDGSIANGVTGAVSSSQ